MKPADTSPSPFDTAAARTPDAFNRLAALSRREIKLHCYRMLGSLHEADDAVQETLLRAWRSFSSFDGRGSFRAWLYRIATNVTFDALAQRRQARRYLPELTTAPGMPEAPSSTEVPWLEPYPDAELEHIADTAPTPEARYSSRQAVRLAFVAVLQRLPPRQRAALLLCDVLGWSAADTAALLESSVASVNSALQRARATMASHGQASVAAQVLAADPSQEALLARYLASWEQLDLDAFTAVLKDDAVYTMPPLPQWYEGRTAIRDFFLWAWPRYAGYRLVPVQANGQPAFAAYARYRSNPEAPWAVHSLHVPDLAEGAVARLTLFIGAAMPRLAEAFGLPPELEE